MEYHGALVMCVPGPQPALELLSRMRPDVLLSDMQMPDWDGAWLVAEAHNRGLLRTVGTLVVTAAAMTPQQVRDAGFDAYLRKPVDPHQPRHDFTLHRHDRAKATTKFKRKNQKRGSATARLDHKASAHQLERCILDWIEVPRKIAIVCIVDNNCGAGRIELDIRDRIKRGIK